MFKINKWFYATFAIVIIVYTLMLSPVGMVDYIKAPSFWEQLNNFAQFLRIAFFDDLLVKILYALAFAFGVNFLVNYLKSSKA